MELPYRPEIDGLRAIAVSSVVLYHAGIGGAGFVGVDVFFVISGYLITSLLLREDRIDLLAFYARRVRRIFPAAAVVILAVLAAAPFLLSAQGVSHTANSGAAASLFGANVFFQMTTGGYFDKASNQMPLLHLWSLSVEEQFYFLWPALLMVIPRRYLLPALIALGLASFALAEWLMQANPQAAFYQMPARFWELAAGGIIAALPARALPRWAAPAGLALTVAACAFPIGHFPGVGALPAVLGASLLIAALHGRATNALLASRPFVGIGLISYSLYLWHWPLLAYYRASTVGAGNTQTTLALCVVAVGLAWLSWRFVEQPFRKMRWSSERLVTAGVGLSLSMCLAGVMYAHNSAGWLLVDGSAEVMASLAEADVVPDPVEQKGARVAVWGDSYARTWLPLAGRLGSAAMLSETGCPPLIGFVVETYRAEACKAFNTAAVARLQGMDVVILAFNWQRYAGDIRGPLTTTLGELSGVRRVIVIAPTPVMQDDLPKCIRAGAECGTSRMTFELEARPLRAILTEAMTGRPNVEVIDPTDSLCTLTRCPGIKDGVALYSDKSHLTRTAVERYVSTL